MTLLTIQAALDAKLESLSGFGDIVTEGMPYTPQRNRPYIYARIASYSESPMGLGPDTPLQIDGTYQMTINRPATEGRAAARQIATILCAVFARRVAIITQDGVSVSLMSASEMPAIDNGDWQSVPVVVRLFASRPAPYAMEVVMTAASGQTYLQWADIGLTGSEVTLSGPLLLRSGNTMSLRSGALLAVR